MFKSDNADALMTRAYFTLWSKERVKRIMRLAFWFFTAVLVGRLFMTAIYYAYL